MTKNSYLKAKLFLVLQRYKRINRFFEINTKYLFKHPA